MNWNWPLIGNLLLIALILLGGGEVLHRSWKRTRAAQKFFGVMWLVVLGAYTLRDVLLQSKDKLWPDSVLLLIAAVAFATHVANIYDPPGKCALHPQAPSDAPPTSRDDPPPTA